MLEIGQYDKLSLFESISFIMSIPQRPASNVYTPPFQLTNGQAEPFAANNGLSYMYLDQNGDAGTTAATEDALQQISEGVGQIIIDMIENSPPGR